MRWRLTGCRTLLDKQVFETERKVIIESTTPMNNPVAKSMLEFRHEFSVTIHATGPLGKIEDLKSLTVDDCRIITGNGIHPTMLFCSGGDLSRILFLKPWRNI